MKITDYKNIYMVGIKGVGMAMLAQFLKGTGFVVSGSDVSDRFPTDKTLAQAKIKVKQGFSLKNFPKKIDLVIYSSAFNFNDNVELKYFKDQGITFLTYAEALGLLFNNYYGISVCGSHGKTTVTSWLGYVLKESGLKPNVLTGSYVKQFKGSALIGKSKYFVAESDEYQNKLRFFNPRGVVLNNIDFDHPDYFKDKKQYFKVFAEFIKKIPKSGWLVFNLEDKLATRASKECSGKTIAYYIRDNNKIIENKAKKIYYASDIEITENGQCFSLFLNNKNLGRFKISLPGRHNISNALAVITTALELGLSLEIIKKHLVTFVGATRRFDVLGKYKGAVIIDDYAHHPSEIKASLQAVRQRYADKNIITVFHPHTFSRTEALINDFAKSFVLSDSLYLIEIYSSAREKQGHISSIDLIEKIRQYNTTINKKQVVKYLKDLNMAEKYLPDKIGPNDVVLLLGAGDIFRIAYHWLKIKV
ncbi:MAG TPA: UDP-N-acetylmuramate--L-alanine ligase [bacterium]|nr:UDP-N-acetylmuramate--L-alanine ligase [bacterium]